MNSDWTAYKNALSFVLSSTIPIVYYGSEQGFNGGADPQCRESLWPHHKDRVRRRVISEKDDSGEMV